MRTLTILVALAAIVTPLAAWGQLAYVPVHPVLNRPYVGDRAYLQRAFLMRPGQLNPYVTPYIYNAPPQPIDMAPVFVPSEAPQPTSPGYEPYATPVGSGYVGYAPAGYVRPVARAGKLWTVDPAPVLIVRPAAGLETASSSPYLQSRLRAR